MCEGRGDRLGFPLVILLHTHRQEVTAKTFLISEFNPLARLCGTEGCQCGHHRDKPVGDIDPRLTSN